MVPAWQLAPGIICRACDDHSECLVYSRFVGTTHVVADLGAFIVNMCIEGPQTMESFIAGTHGAFETEQPEDLNVATANAVKLLQNLGILAQCAPP